MTLRHIMPICIIGAIQCKVNDYSAESGFLLLTFYPDWNKLRRLYGLAYGLASAVRPARVAGGRLPDRLRLAFYPPVR